jgi:hypothetical protein
MNPFCGTLIAVHPTTRALLRKARGIEHFESTNKSILTELFNLTLFTRVLTMLKEVQTTKIGQHRTA